MLQNGVAVEEDLEAGLSDRISFRENRQLLNVSSASVEDSGNYTCTAHNTGGSDTATYVVAVQGELVE